MFHQVNRPNRGDAMSYFFMEKLRTCAKSTDWNKLPGKAASEMTKANCVMWKHDQHECSSCPQAVPKELNKTWSQMVISSPRTSSCSAPYGQETLGFETWLTVWNCGVIFQEGSVCERQPLLKPTTRWCQKSKKSEQSCKSHSYLLPNGHQVPAGPASPSRPFTSQNTGHCPLKGSRQESCMSQHGGKRCRDTLQSWNQVTHLGERETLLIHKKWRWLMLHSWPDFSKPAFSLTPQPLFCASLSNCPRLNDI